MAMFDWIRKAVSANTAEAAVAPGIAESCKNEGNVHLASGDLAAASACYRKAIEIDPAYAEAYNNLGSVLSQQDDFKGAIECCRKALALKPTLVQAHINLGNALRSTGALAEALDAFHAALALAPELVDIHNNYAVLLHELGRLDEAIAGLTTATSVEPWFAHAWVNLGSVLRDKGKFDEAEECFRKAIPLSPPRDETARYCLSLLLLTCGRLPEGWTDYDARFQHAGGTYKRPFRHPEWAGEDLRGRRLLIWGDQGVGDEIMFASMLGEAIARANHCVVECVDKLVPLFSRSFPGAEVVPRVDPPHPATRQHFDFQSSSGGLARWLRPGIENFPHHNGFLKPDARRVEHWSARLAELGPGLKVGICWRSRMRTGVRQLHYTRIDQWGAVFAVPNVHFVNLQYDECTDELADTRKRFGVALHAFPEVDLLDDLDEAAALTRALDLVITVPTAAGRLAAALGVSTWEMAYGTPWVCLGADRPPWFPAQRLFLRRWDEPREALIGIVAKELSAMVTGPSTSAAAVCKNQGNAYLAAGKLDDAADCYRQAIAVDPLYAEAHNNLGFTLLQQGRPDEAEELLKRAIALCPRLGNAHFNLGNLFLRGTRFNEALASFEQALALNPDNADAHYGRGTALYELGNDDEAIVSLRRVLAVAPDHFKAHNGLGLVFQRRRQFDVALERYTHAATLNPAFFVAHHNRGMMFRRLGRSDDAIACFKQVIALQPGVAEAHYELGCALREAGQLEAAIVCYRKAIELRLDHAAAYGDLGLIFHTLEQIDEAENCYRKALALNPEMANVVFNLALLLLSRGQLADGWKHYKFRFSYPDNPSHKRDFPFPEWLGENLKDKALLIWGDQGVGDEILFASLFAEAEALSRRCIIECAPKLVALFARSFPDALVVPRSDPPHPATLNGVDVQIAAGDLPRWLRPTLESFPHHESYLTPPPERVGHWHTRLAGLGRGLKVGFCWRSSLRTGARHLHYSSLDQWGPIFSIQGVHFISLQYDRCDEELAAARKHFDVSLHAFAEVDLFNDLDEVAALTGALDLVITAHTAVSAVAGALGVPTWILTYGTPWTALGTDHIPWLPAQRIYPRHWNQPWEEIIAAIAQALAVRVRQC